MIDGDTTARRYARRRLLGAIAAERVRRRRTRTLGRWTVLTTAVVLVLGITPTGLDGVASPLIGLADAVASAPDRSGVVARHWYSRAVSRELVTETLADGRIVEFLVNATEERWHDAGDTPRRTITYGRPVFFSPEDEDAFYEAGLASRYGPGRTVAISEPDDQYQFVAALDDPDAVELGGALRRRIAGLGDQRMEEVRLLQLAAELIAVHADDPLMRSQTLRMIADIPGIGVVASDRSVVVSIDYMDGDRPLRLMYEFDGDTAHLVGEYLAALATQTEPATVLRAARHSLPRPADARGSSGS